MSYNLWVDGLRDVDRIARLFNKKVIGRDPLSGVVDGVNTYYYAQFYPVMSSPTPSIYTSGSALIPVTDYAIDYDSGMVTFVVPPSVQPSASYTTAKYSETTMRSILVAGFDEMEGLWFRGLTLSETVGANAVLPITESSGSAYITTSSGSDPQVGAIYFGDSRNQINLYAKCVQLAFYRTLMGEHALSDFIWTEAQGLRVDKSMTVRNLKLAYDALKDTLDDILKKAQYEWYGDALFGGAIYSPHTQDYVAHNYWQKRSISEDWRANTPYVGTRW